MICPALPRRPPPKAGGGCASCFSGCGGSRALTFKEGQVVPGGTVPFNVRRASREATAGRWPDRIPAGVALGDAVNRWRMDDTTRPRDPSATHRPPAPRPVSACWVPVENGARPAPGHHVGPWERRGERHGAG
ncbi:MAG: hypothetical protein VKO39_07340 [Cyanobacteriota bacterium]|nr:hypothetical protein [Cyanobacteriota bacterium]